MMEDILSEHFQFVTGSRFNSMVYIDPSTNYIYKVRMFRKGGRRVNLVCVVKNCKGSISCNYARKSPKQPHDHKASLKECNKYKLLMRLKERMISSNKPIRAIFDEESAKFEDDPPQLVFTDIYNCLYRLRNHYVPPNQKNINRLSRAMNESRNEDDNSNSPKHFLELDQENAETSDSKLLINKKTTNDDSLMTDRDSSFQASNSLLKNRSAYRKYRSLQFNRVKRLMDSKPVPSQYGVDANLNNDSRSVSNMYGNDSFHPEIEAEQFCDQDMEEGDEYDQIFISLLPLFKKLMDRDKPAVIDDITSMLQNMHVDPNDIEDAL